MAERSTVKPNKSYGNRNSANAFNWRVTRFRKTEYVKGNEGRALQDCKNEQSY